MIDDRATDLDFGPDPSNDNYVYFLNTEGSIFERYKYYNGSDGNSLEAFTDTNRGSSAQPDAEDINRDNTMNTIDSYFEYELDITPTALANTNNKYINDVRCEPYHSLMEMLEMLHGTNSEFNFRTN